MRPGTNSPNARRTPQKTVVLPASMAGAVDLAAVKARTEAQQRAAEAPPPSAGAVVVDVTEATFQAEVLDRSFQVPVLIDLWADWCQPCKQLSPVLEKLAVEGGGSWILAKVDTEANPRLAQALQVQSIPTVYAVIGGQLIPGFQGALPEAHVREFVGAVLQAGQEAGLSGPVGAAAPEAGADDEELDDPRFVAAEEALDAGDYAGAVKAYEAILAAEPGNEQAALALKQVRLFERIEKLDASVVERASAQPEDVEAQLGAADLQIATNKVDDALQRLIDLVRRTSGEDRDRVRARLIEYFDLLGPDDPRVAPARRALAMALF